MARDTDANVQPSGNAPPPPAAVPAFITSANPNPPGVPFMGPVDKTGVTASLGMKGKQRWDWVSTQAPSGMQPLGHDWDSWVQSLPEDPLDIEYSQLLRNAKQNAASRERLRSQQGDKPIEQLTGPMGATQPRITGKSGQGVITGKAAPVLGSLPGAPKNKPDPQEELQHRLENKGIPLVQGLPVTENDVLGDPKNPGAAPDPHVQQWIEGKNLQLDNQSAQIAARSGKWVYTGEVADPAGGRNFKRSMYVYLDDAEAQIASYSAGEIKSFQKRLGQPETGVLTSELQQDWHKAVLAGSAYAQAGQKVELKFIFEMLIRSKEMAKAAGGGGGGRFGNESGADMVGADYYQAMMQVLGDISGVGKVA